jgi:hydroxymethylglutaryl-CoA synthase
VVNRIAAHASYVPRYVLTREAARAAWPRTPMAVASRAVPALDEDPITMGADAALRALDRAGIGGDELSAVFFATESSPYVVKSAAAVVADYVGAPSSACVLDAGAGAHAGLLSLVNALRDRELGERGPILVVAADTIFGAPDDASDLGFGAGAVAFVVGREGFAALADFDCSYSSYSNLWQAPGDRHLRRYDDDRFDRSAGYVAQMTASLEGFLARAEQPPDWYALQLAGTADVGRVAGSVRADRLVGRELASRIGDAGCANALLALALALELAAPGETVLAQAYGAGTVSALFRVESADRPAGAEDDVPADGRVELSYVQYAKHRGLIPLAALPDLGASFAASPAWERSKEYTVGLRGMRCMACGSLNFPRRSYCLDCRGQEFEEVALPRRAAVVTYNLQYVVGIGPEEAPLPICTALLENEEPGRYGGKVAALITDADPESVQVGTAVELVPRRGDVEHGLVKYGWKFRPVGAAA